MESLAWCKKQGLRLTKENPELAKAYIERALSDYNTLERQNPVWQAIIAYYACYHALYAVVVRYGISSKIHSCTINLISFFETIKQHKSFLENLKEERERTQYYLREPKAPDAEKVEKFITLCKLELEDVNQDKIEKVRKIIREA